MGLCRNLHARSWSLCRSGMVYLVSCSCGECWDSTLPLSTSWGLRAANCTSGGGGCSGYC